MRYRLRIWFFPSCSRYEGDAATDPLARLNMEDIKSGRASMARFLSVRCLLSIVDGPHVDTPKYKSLDENGKHRNQAFTLK